LQAGYAVTLHTLLISARLRLPENGNPQTSSAKLAPANPPAFPLSCSYFSWPSVGTECHLDTERARVCPDPDTKHEVIARLQAIFLAFQEVAHLIPEDVPLILETPVSEGDMGVEIEKVREALPINRATIAA
jgi:hypothetical protein